MNRLARALRRPARTLRRLAGRSAAPGPADAGVAVPDAIAATREALHRLLAQARATRRRADSALARRVNVEHAVRAQFRLLDSARDETHAAIAAADGAAQHARAHADRDRAAYEQAAAGLRSQLAVLDAARAQLTRIGGRASMTAAEGHRLLEHSARSLETALQEQVSLLARLERLERRRAIERARPGRADPP